ncbi:5-(carboxyamino)imidazole ribonucleotide synthase [Acidomonas methanolica]|uniref:5-(carboxyamino)imidazole ribonucleotide synthase n=1 Tax=Acidomonas methanolica TaxID=437 RepID=UPI00211A7E1E|nr:5-(carboxyamino)imidazole ribonucleotide synthase [Acidomonas methanolica]
MSAPRIFRPGATIGIVGGGQLGRMSAMAAARLGFHVHILTPETNSPAAEVARGVTLGAYDDEAALRDFAAHVDVVTFEFENVSATGLALLESLRPVRPGRVILETSQDRITEKTRLAELGAATAPWRPARDAAELDTAIAALGFPLILKTTRLGYDGKGQFPLPDAAAFAALDVAALPWPLIAEGYVDFDREISVMVARGIDGTVRCFDATQNIHRNGILDLSLAPAPVAPELARAAQDLAARVAEGLGLVGLMGVEMFVTADGGLLVNEIAPRPHNSGHWTMDACLADQFEMHVRAVAGLPLPPAMRHGDAVMKNLIGPDDMALCDAILASPGQALHLYGKAEARPGRKMGHVTIRFPFGALPGEAGISAALGPLARQRES